VAAQPPWVYVTHLGTSYCTLSLICVSRRKTIAPQNHNNSYSMAGACAACVGGYIIIIYAVKLRKRQVNRIAISYYLIILISLLVLRRVQSFVCASFRHIILLCFNIIIYRSSNPPTAFLPIYISSFRHPTNHWTTQLFFANIHAQSLRKNYFFASVYVISCRNNASIFNFSSFFGRRVNLVDTLRRSFF